MGFNVSKFLKNISIFWCKIWSECQDYISLNWNDCKCKRRGSAIYSTLATKVNFRQQKTFRENILLFRILKIMVKIVQMTSPCQKPSFYKIIALPRPHSYLPYALDPKPLIFKFCLTLLRNIAIKFSCWSLIQLAFTIFILLWIYQKLALTTALSVYTTYSFLF